MDTVLNGMIGSNIAIVTCFPIDTIKNRLQTGRKLSFGGLYKGLGSELLGNLPSTVVYWSVYSQGRYNELSPFSASILSSACSNFIDSPFDYRKKSLQLGLIPEFTSKKFLKFSTLNMVHSMVYNSVYMPALNYLVNEKKYDRTLSIFACCTTSSIIAYPLDLLRTKVISPLDYKLANFTKGLATRILYGNLYSGVYMNIFLYLQNNKI